MNRLFKLLPCAWKLVVLPLAGGIVLAASCLAQGQTNEFVTDADKSYGDAVQIQKQAEGAKSAGEAGADYSNAVAQCDLAVKMRPDFFLAQATAAHCLYRLAQLSDSKMQHRDLIEKAKDRFVLAAKCAGVQPALFREWGAMLMSESNLPENAVARQSLLAEARSVFESGLKQTSFSGERALLEQDFGVCLLLLAQNTHDAAGKIALYEQADHAFTSASRVASVANTPQLCARWGAALVDYAKLTNNRAVLWQAIDRLGTAMEQDGQNLEVHYNLACAYALMGQPGQAMRHLQFCLDHDDARRRYYNAALKDPDLDALRSTSEFNAIFGHEPEGPPVISQQPALSDR